MDNPPPSLHYWCIQVEWLEGGGAVYLAAHSTSVASSEPTNDTVAECLVIRGDTFRSQEVTLNVSADSNFTITTNSSTLQVCRRDVSMQHDLQPLVDVMKHLRFDCRMDCTFPSNRTFVVFFAFKNGSESLTSETRVWITSRPVVYVSNAPITVLYTEGSQPVFLFGNSSLTVGFNRQRSLRSLYIRLTLLDILDVQQETLSVNATNVHATFNTTNVTSTLTLLFPGNTMDTDVANILRLIRYYSNGSCPHSGIRHIEVVISNGRLSSDPVVIRVDVRTSLVIADIPRKKYWQVEFGRPVRLAEMAVLKRRDKRDASPVYRGRVRYINFMSRDWTTDPLTRLQCSKLTNPVTKLFSCIDFGSSMPVNLIKNGIFQGVVETLGDIQRYNFSAGLKLTVLSDQVVVAPWSLSVWLLLNSPDNHLLITKFEKNTMETIYHIDVCFDGVTFVYTSTLNVSVTATFAYPLLLNVSLWHHFVLIAGSLGVQGYVDGQCIDVMSMKLDNETISSHSSKRLPSPLDQTGHLEMSVVHPLSNTPAVSLAGVMMSNRVFTDLQVKCAAGCEEQLHVNTDIIPYNLLKQLKPVFSNGGQMLSLSGPASLDAYTLLLQSLSYVTFANPPDESPRSIKFYISDKTFRVHHDMQLVHVCNATENCGNAVNVTCEMVNATTHQCICPMASTIFDTKTQTCTPLVSCADEGVTCGNNSLCVEISEIELLCNCTSGFKKDGNSNCVDINDCVANVCHNGGTCVDGVNAFVCVCPFNYNGSKCDVLNDMCLPLCVNGRCQGNRCVCDSGYSGLQCDIDINAQCTKTSCLNGGTCIEVDDTYQCLCLSRFDGARCQSNITETTVSATVVVAIGVSIGTVVVLLIVIIAIFITLRKRRTNSLMVEGQRRMRFTYSQYLGESHFSSRKASRKSYAVVQPKANHSDLKKDLRPTVRRLSMAFEHGETGSVFGSISGSLHEMSMPGLFRPRSNTDTSEFFRPATALPNVDESTTGNIINSNFTADDILESNEDQLDDKPDEITDDDDDDSTYINNFEKIIENFGNPDSNSIGLPGHIESNNSHSDDNNDTTSEVMHESPTSKSLLEAIEPTNEGLLTPGQVRARQQAIAMLSNFSWPDVSDDGDESDNS